MLSARKTIVTDISYRPCPVLTQNFGNSAARVLQQLHYWLSKENLSYGIIHDNRQWIRNSYHQWQQQIKETQILSLVTIRRAFYLLECKNIILSKQFEQNKSYQGGDQVKSYTIDYDKLESCVGDLTKTLITRPRSIVEQQFTQEKRAGNTANFSTKNSEQFRNGSPEDDQMSTPPDQMSTPPYNVYISNKLSNKPPHLRQTRSLRSIQQNTNHENKNDKREKNNISLKMIEIWNDVIEQSPGKISLTQERSQTLGFVFVHFFQKELESWSSFCQKIASSKFLMGEVSSFRAHIDWVLKSSTIQRILEDGYSFGDRVIPQNQSSSEGEGGTQSIQTQCIPQIETENALKIRALLKQKIERKYGDDVNYNSWFMNTVIIVEEKEDETIRTLFVKTSFIRDTILTRFADIYETLFDTIQIGLPDINQQSGNAPTQKVCDEIQNQIEKMDLENNNNNTLSLEENKELCEPLSEHVDPDDNIDLSYTNDSQERTILLYEENITKPLPITDVDHEEHLYQEKSNIEPQKSLINPSYNLEQKAAQSPEMDEKSYLPIQDDFLTMSASSQNDENKIRIPKKRMSCVLSDIKTLQIHKMLKQHLPFVIYEEKFKDADIRIRDGNTIFVISAHERHNDTYSAYHEVIESIFDEIMYEEESTIHCQKNHSDVHIVNEPSEVQNAISDLSSRDCEFYLTRLNQLTSVHQEPIQNMVEEDTKAIQTREKIYSDKQDPPEKKIEQTPRSRFEGLITPIGTKSFGHTNKLEPFNKKQSTMGSLRDCTQKRRHPLETQSLNYTERISLFANVLSEYKAHSWNAYGEYRKYKISPPVHMQKCHLKRSYFCLRTIDPPFTTRINVGYKAFGCSCINLLAYQSKNCLSKVPLFLERQ